MTREELILSRVEYKSSAPLSERRKITFHNMHDRASGKIRYVVVTVKDRPVMGFSAWRRGDAMLPRKFTNALVLAAFPFI